MSETQVESEKLTRQQRRLIERINNDAQAMHKRLCNQFAEFFIDNDPESEEVTLKQKEVNAKWRVYCKNRNLNPEVHDMVNQTIEQIKNQYKEELNETHATDQTPG